MNKRWLTVMILLLMLVVLWLSRATLVHWAANSYLAPYKLAVGCLEWDTDSRLNLHIQHLCLQHSDARLEIYDVVWSRSKNTLDIGQAIVTLVPAENGVSPAKSSSNPIELTLPPHLPALNVHNLRVEAEQLREPLQLTIEQTAANQLLVSSDWQAQLRLENGIITARIDWTLQDLVRLSAHFPAQFLEPSVLQAPIVTDISFDGQYLRSQSQLDLQQSIVWQQCAIALQANGLVGINADWVSRTAEIDLSQFAVKGHQQQCALIQDIPEPLRFSAATLSLPALLTITDQSVRTAKVSVSALQSQTDKAANLELQFTNLEWRFNSNLLAGHYQIKGTMQDLAQLQSSGQWQLNQEGLAVSGEDNNLQLAQLTLSSWSVNQLDAKFSFSLQPDGRINLDGELQLASLGQQDTTLADIQTQIRIDEGRYEQFRLVTNSKIASISQPPLQVNAVAGQFDIDVNGLSRFVATGKSLIADISFHHHAIGAVQMQHQVQLDLDNQNVTSHNQIGLGKGLQAELDSTNQQLRLRIAEQPLTAVADIAKQWLPAISIQSGQLDADIKANMATLQGGGPLEINNLTLAYEDNLIRQASYRSNIAIDSAGLQLAPARLHIEQLDAGVVIQGLDASLQAQQNQFSASDISGQIFAGQFDIDQLWLDGRDQTAMLKLSDIDTAKILDLQKQSGIEVSGLIKGNLPIRISNGDISIAKGEISNQGAGKLLINDNQAFNALKAQQPKLEKQLALLENLQINSLNSSVNLAPDGLLKMDIAMQGYNPLQKEQVNFNYGHEENILVLLEALRLTETLTDKIEEKINK
ncbi:intermembrane phospholipid transport protein YdbH family protein [Neptunicella sp. SCSIO 80796]|uniref:intermembrane phospholipid transport protein YdbH family protein n=1 Tax=Neptunicella plasticusilytica TaxID=3117012 RepID=UPI003A4D9C73